MACDTTHLQMARRQAAEGAQRLVGHPHECICDCAVVEAVKRADRRRVQAPARPADDIPGSTPR